ncbi:MAG: hypothetical protein RI891_25 [Gemmatimonadota bacterium]
MRVTAVVAFPAPDELQVVPQFPAMLYVPAGTVENPLALLKATVYPTVNTTVDTVFVTVNVIGLAFPDAWTKRTYACE